MTFAFSQLGVEWVADLDHVEGGAVELLAGGSAQVDPVGDGGPGVARHVHQLREEGAASE